MYRVRGAEVGEKERENTEKVLRERGLREGGGEGLRNRERKKQE